MTLSTVLFCEEIETSIPFWVDSLGFELSTEVPHENRLGFVILKKQQIELMLQTWASVAADLPTLATEPRGLSCGLFLQVEDFEATTVALRAYPLAFPERTTFYGMRELGVMAPSGHIVTVAAQV